MLISHPNILVHWYSPDCKQGETEFWVHDSKHFRMFFHNFSLTHTHTPKHSLAGASNLVTVTLLSDTSFASNPGTFSGGSVQRHPRASPNLPLGTSLSLSLSMPCGTLPCGQQVTKTFHLNLQLSNFVFSSI